jgi:Golgi nucleoside diphosphatase
MLKKIIRFFERYGKSPIEIEIYYLKKSIRQNELKLEAMSNEFYDLNGVCCVGCMFGKSYYSIEDKLERQRERLKYLIGKLDE